MRPLRILVVEDNLPFRAIFADTLGTALKSAGFDTVFDLAASRGEGIAIANGEIDAAIVDLRLPDGGPYGGVEVAEHVSEVAPLAYVLVLSGYIDSIAASRIQQFGADHVPKDGALDIHEIARLIARGVRSAYERVAPLLGETREPLPDKLEEIEAAIVRYALAKHDGNKSAAARELGVARQSLQARTRPPAGPRKK